MALPQLSAEDRVGGAALGGALVGAWLTYACLVVSDRGLPTAEPEPEPEPVPKRERERELAAAAAAAAAAVPSAAAKEDGKDQEDQEDRDNKTTPLPHTCSSDSAHSKFFADFMRDAVVTARCVVKVPACSTSGTIRPAVTRSHSHGQAGCKGLDYHSSAGILHSLLPLLYLLHLQELSRVGGPHQGEA